MDMEGSESNPWPLVVFGLCHCLYLLRARKNSENELQRGAQCDRPANTANDVGIRHPAPSRDKADSLGEGETLDCNSVRIIKRGVTDLRSHFSSAG